MIDKARHRSRSAAALAAAAAAASLFALCVSALAQQPVQPAQPATLPLNSISALKKVLDADLATDARLGLKPGTTAGTKDPHLWQQYNYLLLRAYPNDSIDYNAYKAAVAQRDQMSAGPLKARFRNAGSPPPGGGFGIESLWSTFYSLGPNNLQPPGQWAFGAQPVTGRANGVAFDPQHSGTYYMTSATGGTWKTTDSGSHWIVLSDQWSSLCGASVAVDPVNSQNVYVGTGDFPYGTQPFGIMKSTDGGNTWTNIGTSFGNNSVNKILIDPDNPSIITVATGMPRYGGVYRSTNGGSTWTQVITQAGVYTDVECSLKTSNGYRYYYATGEHGGGVWISSDRGATWTKLTTPMVNNGGNGLSVACSPLYAYQLYLFCGDDHKVYRSSNWGSTWTDITGNLSSIDWGQAWYDSYIKCGQGLTTYPFDVVYVGILDTYSTTGNGTWTSLLQTYTGNDRAHTDQHDLAINPANYNDILLGNDGGVYDMHVSNGAFLSATSLNATINTVQFYGADFYSGDFAWALGGSQDNGSECDNIGGGTTSTSTWYGVTGGDGGNARINQTYPWYQYTTSQGGGVYHTTNYWNSGYTSSINPSYGSGETMPWEAATALDPSTWNWFYTATDHLYRFDESSDTWTDDLGGQDLAGSGGIVTSIAVAPTDSRVIYTGSSDGQIWMSTFYGNSGYWYRIDSGLPSGSITSIAVSPTTALDIIVSIGGTGHDHVYRCTNTLYAPAWMALDSSGPNSFPDIPATAVAREPFDPDFTYYVGTDIGVFYTTDAGNTWYSINRFGLPNVQVTGLKALQGTGGELGYDQLDVTTYGRGAWTAQLEWPATLYNLTLATPGVNGGGTDTGTVSMIGEVPYGGATINLYSSSPAASVPATVAVPWGSSSYSFGVTGNPVTTATPATITAVYNGISRSANVTVYPATLKTLSLTPTSQTGGLNVTGKVSFASTLSAAATVPLSSTNVAAHVPSTVTVAAGSSSATFTITTSAVSANTTGYVKASYGGISVQSSLTVKPVTLSKVSVSPTSVTGGAPSTGTATLTAPAGPAAITVGLSSSNTAAATVPATISIPVGSTSGSFTVTTYAVTASTTVTIKATIGSVSKTVTLTVKPVAMSSLSISPNPVLGGNPATGTATLNAAAGTSGVKVTLSSSNTAVATVPASITVVSGSKTGTFTVTTKTVAANTSVVITASAGGVSKTFTLKVNYP